MSRRDELKARLPASVAAPLVAGVRRGRGLRHQVGEATHQGPLGRMLRRTDSLREAIAEDRTLLPDLEARVAELEHDAALVAERMLAARDRG